MSLFVDIAVLHTAHALLLLSGVARSVMPRSADACAARARLICKGIATLTRDLSPEGFRSLFKLSANVQTGDGSQVITFPRDDSLEYMFFAIKVSCTGARA